MYATLARNAVEWGESLRGVFILSRHLASVQKFSPGAHHSHNISESAKLTMHTSRKPVLCFEGPKFIVYELSEEREKCPARCATNMRWQAPPADVKATEELCEVAIGGK